ncbi:hypothetical protein AMECASPLE_010943 [Ameca splendens]|uniref:Uncharacterized protein n=1 Tax=Ameca splendens TaxID=208324 RepID=A0ABV0Y0Y1_9TELE
MGQNSPSVPSHSEKHPSDIYPLAPSEQDISSYARNSSRLYCEPKPPSTKDSDCLNETLQPSDLSLSSWIASTPLVTQTGSIHLNLPPDGASQCVKYTRSSEEGLCSDHVVQPAHRTVHVAEQALYTAL